MAASMRRLRLVSQMLKGGPMGIGEMYHNLLEGKSPWAAILRGIEISQSRVAAPPVGEHVEKRRVRRAAVCPC